MGALLLIVSIGAVVFVWAVSRAGRRAREAEAFTRLMGFTSTENLHDAVALAVRAGVNPTQARDHYAFLVDCFGRPATEHAARLVREHRFDAKFPGLGLEAAMSRLSAELAGSTPDA